MGGDRRPTQRDVAAAAGVSVQTVSNLFTGRRHHLSAETEQRILEAIDQLGYTPNSTARGLRSRSTRMLAFVIGDASEDFLGDPLTDRLLSGVGAVLRERDYALVIDSYRPGGPAKVATRHLAEGRVDAALVMVSGGLDERRRIVRQLEVTGGRFALLQEHTDLTAAADKPVWSVSAADFAGSRALTQHLIDRGHELISFVGTREQWSALEQRTGGYVAAMSDAGLADRVEVVVAEDFSPRAGLATGPTLLDRRVRPTAIMCGNDSLALGVLRAAGDRGIEVPEQLAITGFNDFAFAEFTTPPLTTVSLPGEAMGRLAARMLLDPEPPVEQTALVLDVELRLRGSTGD
jgi:LacI family transcriptional regulator